MAKKREKLKLLKFMIPVINREFRIGIGDPLTTGPTPVRSRDELCSLSLLFRRLRSNLIDVSFRLLDSSAALPSKKRLHLKFDKLFPTLPNLASEMEIN